MRPYQPEAQARTGERVILVALRVGIAHCASYSPWATNDPGWLCHATYPLREREPHSQHSLRNALLLQPLQPLLAVPHVEIGELRGDFANPAMKRKDNFYAI